MVFYVCLIFKKKAKNKFKRTFFASTGNRLTLKNLIKKCIKILRKDLNIKWGVLNYRKNVIMKPIKVNKIYNICKEEKINPRLKSFLFN